MPFVLIVIGAVIFLTAINGTTIQLGSMLKADTFGQGGYIRWFVAIVIVGALGYIKALKTPSDYTLLLVILVLFLSHSGVFAEFNQAIAAAPTNTTASSASTNISATADSFADDQPESGSANISATDDSFADDQPESGSGLGANISATDDSFAYDQPEEVAYP